MLGADSTLRSHYEGEVESVGIEVLRMEGPIESSTRAVCARITKRGSHVEVGR
jgi:hypothetical protein